MKKSIASLIVSILILTAPGLPCYAQFSAVLHQGAGARVSVNAPVGRMAAPLAAPSHISPTLAQGLSLSGLGQVAIPTPAVSELANPEVQPDVAAAAVAAAAIPAGAGLVQKAAVAAAVQAGPMGLNRLIKEKESLSLSPQQVTNMGAAQAKNAAASIMDRILGIEPIRAASDSEAFEPAANRAPGLSAPAASLSAASRPAAPPAASPAAAPRAARHRLVSALFSFGRVAASAGAVVGLQLLGASLLPMAFGLVPIAAVWAVSSGVLLFPVALYARHRLALRDSPRLTKVKWVMDAAIGAFLGAVVIAAPSLAAIVTVPQLAMAALPASAMIAASKRGSSSLLDGLAVWGSVAALPMVLGAAAPGLIGAAPLAGLMVLPVMTTLAFFLGRIIFSAESGRPFSVPGSVQKLRFPVFQWVMSGVVFALLTGFSAVYSNLAFGAWQFLGNKTYGWDKQAPLWKNLVYNLLNFNTLYLGLLAFSAATAFTNPLTFLVLAFAPERMARWTEALLGKLLPQSKPAPSTQAAPAADPNVQAQTPARWPNFHYWLKTGLLIATIAAGGAIMGATVFGFASLGKNLIIAGLISTVSVIFSPKIIKMVMKTTPANETQDPEFFSIMKDLRERINARRAAQGKKPIPMPEMVIDPLNAPNAYATGRSPFHALVGMTVGIKEMLLDAESLRAGLIRLLAASDPASKAFKAFRKAISGSISGVAPDATPVQAAEAIKSADPAALKGLGMRALRGVMAHEFSHVMDRHMLLGAIAGAISSAVAFSSYAVMWAVGHAKILIKKIKDRMFPASARKRDARMGIEPISTGLTMKSLPALLRVFAALWGPVVLQITQMAASRSNEGMADEDGAKLSQDPEALALGLGLLTTWRPKTAGPAVASERLPLVAANAHLFTVNPLEQMHRAGALPKMDGLAEMVVGKQDDFFFNLFITHPDTMQRIERLFEMSEANDAGNGGR